MRLIELEEFDDYLEFAKIGFLHSVNEEYYDEF